MKPIKVITTLKIKNAIRDIPNFPKKGIMFKDITKLLAEPTIFAAVVNKLWQKFKKLKVNKIVVIESRGFIFGSPLAYKLKAGIVPVRKKGKLPYKTISASYCLEYGKATLEMHTDALKAGDRVVIIDDLLATGGTVSATIELVEKLKAKIVGIGVLIELTFLKGREKLKGNKVVSLIKY